MLKITKSLFFALIFLNPFIACAEDELDTLKTENNRLLELEALLLGQLDRGDAEPVVVEVPAPKKEKKAVVVKRNESDRVVTELRKENARLEREIMELNASLRSLQQNQNIERVSFKPDPSALYVEAIKSPTILRVSPSVYASRVHSVNAGEKMRVSIHKGSWYLVQVAGIQAWIPKEDVVEIN